MPAPVISMDGRSNITQAPTFGSLGFVCGASPTWLRFWRLVPTTWHPAGAVPEAVHVIGSNLEDCPFIDPQVTERIWSLRVGAPVWRMGSALS